MMNIGTADGKRNVDIGSSSDYVSLTRTIKTLLADTSQSIPLVITFLDGAGCEHSQALETARQFNLARDMLSAFQPNCVICSDGQPTVSYVTTSCANYFITPDGQDLLFEIVSILTYAAIAETDVEIE